MARRSYLGFVAAGASVVACQLIAGLDEDLAGDARADASADVEVVVDGGADAADAATDARTDARWCATVALPDGAFCEDFEAELTPPRWDSPSLAKGGTLRLVPEDGGSALQATVPAVPYPTALARSGVTFRCSQDLVLEFDFDVDGDLLQASKNSNTLVFALEAASGSLRLVWRNSSVERWVLLVPGTSGYDLSPLTNYPNGQRTRRQLRLTADVGDGGGSIEVRENGISRLTAPLGRFCASDGGNTTMTLQLGLAVFGDAGKGVNAHFDNLVVYEP